MTACPVDLTGAVRVGFFLRMTGAQEGAGAARGADDVLRFCDGKLARFKLPKAIRFVDTIPRNATGKALKRLLREQYASERLP